MTITDFYELCEEWDSDELFGEESEDMDFRIRNDMSDTEILDLVSQLYPDGNYVGERKFVDYADYVNGIAYRIKKYEQPAQARIAKNNEIKNQLDADFESGVINYPESYPELLEVETMTSGRGWGAQDTTTFLYRFPDGSQKWVDHRIPTNNSEFYALELKKRQH